MSPPSVEVCFVLFFPFFYMNQLMNWSLVEIEFIAIWQKPWLSQSERIFKREDILFFIPFAVMYKKILALNFCIFKCQETSITLLGGGGVSNGLCPAKEARQKRMWSVYLKRQEKQINIQCQKANQRSPGHRAQSKRDGTREQGNFWGWRKCSES